MKQLILTSLLLLAGVSRAAAADPSDKNQVAEAEVYLLAGQSNMQGLGQLKELPSDAQRPPAKILFWNGTTFEPLNPGKTKLSSRPGEFGPEIGFAAEMAAKKPEHPIYLIKFYIGGQPLHYGWNGPKWIGGKPGPNRKTFYPGTGPEDPNIGLHYRRMQAMFEKALATLNKNKIAYKVRGVAWMQGEADSKNKTSASEYASMLRLLKSRLQQDLKNRNLPLVYGQVLPYSPPLERFVCRDEIRRQMQEADGRSGKPQAIPGAWMVSTDDFPLRVDHVHYNTEGQLRLGKAFAKTMIEAQAAREVSNSTEPRRRDIGISPPFVEAK